MNRNVVALLVWVCLLASSAAPGPAQSSDGDWQLWTAGFYRHRRASALDFSMEYQVRLDEDMSALKSHFVEFQGYGSPHRTIELFGAYRLTRRPDHTEHRVMGGLFWFWQFGGRRSPVEGEPRLRIRHQVAYQRDFGVRWTEDPIDSNSVRWVTTAAMLVTRRLAPLVFAGVLATWNREYDFDMDKLRLGAGLRIKRGEADRFALTYFVEENRARDLVTRSNVIYLRYEMFR